MTKNLDDIQKELAVWAQKNFGKQRTDDLRLIGATEELGELVTQQLEQLVPLLHVVRELGILSHHHLKEKCGIRGTSEFHREKSKDAVGDVIIFLMDYCELHGWSLWNIINETWDEVRQRNWIDDPLTGGLKRYVDQQK